MGILNPAVEVSVEHTLSHVLYPGWASFPVSDYGYAVYVTRYFYRQSFSF